MATETTTAPALAIDLPREAIDAFCRRWKITELAVFGSVLRDDFGPESDVDLLVAFAHDAEWTLFDLASMERELEGVIGRRVEVTERAAIERSRNPFRREAILGSARTVHER